MAAHVGDEECDGEELSVTLPEGIRCSGQARNRQQRDPVVLAAPHQAGALPQRERGRIPAQRVP